MATLYMKAWKVFWKREYRRLLYTYNIITFPSLTHSLLPFLRCINVSYDVIAHHTMGFFLYLYSNCHYLYYQILYQTEKLWICCKFRLRFSGDAKMFCFDISFWFSLVKCLILNKTNKKNLKTHESIHACRISNILGKYQANFADKAMSCFKKW